MSIVTWNEPHFKRDEPSRRQVKIGRKAEQLAQWTTVCRLVDRRDGGRCRVCHRRCDVKALTLIDRAHRHHIAYRSAGGADETWNVVTVCAGCHEQQHQLGTLDVRGNADTSIEIWRLDTERLWFMDAREVRPGQWERG